MLATLGRSMKIRECALGWVVLFASTACIDVSDLVFDRSGDSGGQGGSAGGGAGAESSGGSGGKTYAQVVMEDGPAAYWRMGEAEGTSIASDASGSELDALYFAGDGGDIQRGVEGAIEGDADTAVRVSGGAEIVLDPHPFYFTGLAPYSFEAWVMTGPSGGQPNWILSCPSGYAGVGYFTSISETGALHERQGEPDLYDKIFVDTLFGNAFRHVVVTFDGDEGWLYIDAVPTQQAAEPFDTPIDPHVSSFDLVATGAPTSITVDELAVYDHALSLERVELHFRCGSTGDCGE